jgi:hypothetical protein
MSSLAFSLKYKEALEACVLGARQGQVHFQAASCYILVGLAQWCDEGEYNLPSF